LSYCRPTELPDAVRWLTQNALIGARVAAGCTDLFPATTKSTLEGPVLDITGIESLRGIKDTGSAWWFGATTTWTDIIRADLPAAFDGLKLAAREVGSVQIQNSGTIGGNLCNASPAADGSPCWLTLDAFVELVSERGVRKMPLAEFMIGPRQTALAYDEILSAIVVPRKAGEGRSGFLKLGARKYLVISIAMVAARIVESSGGIESAHISVGSCSGAPVRLPLVESALIRQSVHGEITDRILSADVTDAIAPISDIRGGADYRNSSAVELVKRTVAQTLKIGEDRVA